MPKLRKRFDFSNTINVYRRVKEEDIEKMQGGRYQFVTECVTDGRTYQGTAYELTVSDMMEFEYWRMQAIASKKDATRKIYIVIAAQPPLPEAKPTRSKPA